MNVDAVRWKMLGTKDCRLNPNMFRCKYVSYKVYLFEFLYSVMLTWFYIQTGLLPVRAFEEANVTLFSRNMLGNYKYSEGKTKKEDQCSQKFLYGNLHDTTSLWRSNSSLDSVQWDRNCYKLYLLGKIDTSWSIHNTNTLSFTEKPGFNKVL